MWQPLSVARAQRTDDVLVVDAALIVEFALDRLGEQAGLLFGGEQELVAPCLLWSEVPSVLNEMAFRGEISRALADRAIERFVAGKLHVSQRRHTELTITAVGIARELGWAKTYDAEYLALARLLNTRVVTLDLRLRRGAERLGLVVTPNELTGAAEPESAAAQDEPPSSG
jgi:predicted nucleic acid-binding protein